MPNPTTVDIKDHLVAQGVGTEAATSGWSIRIGQEPTSPDTTITLYDTGGLDPSAKWLFDEPTIQIRVRGSEWDYLGAFTRIQLVKDTLLGLQATTINTTLYVGIWQISDILFLRYDDNNRPIFVSNWRFVREPNTGTNRTSLSG